MFRSGHSGPLVSQELVEALARAATVRLTVEDWHLLVTASLTVHPNASSETYRFGPSIQWAAFDLGRVRQRIKQREAATDCALARYEQTVLRALE